MEEVNLVKADLSAIKRDLDVERAKRNRTREALVRDRTARLRTDATKAFAWGLLAFALISPACIASGVWLALSSSSEDSLLRIVGLPALLGSDVNSGHETSHAASSPA